MELLCLLVIKEQFLLLVYPLMTLFIFQSYPSICFMLVNFVTGRKVGCADPYTGQVLGIGRKVGHMFEVHDLKIPSQVVSAVATTATSSPDL